MEPLSREDSVLAVARALGYKASTSRIISSLQKTDVAHIDIGLKNSKAICINCSGLYVLTRFSNKPNAEDLYRFCEKAVFKSSVREEILMNNHSIRIEVPEGKLKEILDCLTEAQETIYRCYDELNRLGVLPIAEETTSGN